MVQLTYPIGKGGFVFRYINVMDVIVHEIVPDQTNPIPLEILREQSEVDNAVMG